ncbi:MAG: hypothetical protein JWN43_800, partial [Gammaproteobacteria bacterium]|nr:hypothetical protein [Gammaproteobacteria bacterium]
MLVAQCDAMNVSRIGTVVCVPLTRSNSGVTGIVRTIVKATL